MTSWAVGVVAVVGGIIIVCMTGLMIGSWRYRKRVAQVTGDRSLSRLPDHSCYEAWRRAADQSQAVSDARRKRRRRR